MSRPAIEPITPELLPAFCDFLHQHLDASRSPQQWLQGLQTTWCADAPNHGFLLRVEGRIVGGIGAYYAERVLDGQTLRSCNITSWCVLDAYRQQSMRLAMAILAQPGYDFNDFSPTKVVAGTLQFLKFKALPDGQWLAANRPWPGAGRVISRPAEIEATLKGAALRDYLAHRDYPWLRHVLLGDGLRWSHVIYKHAKTKGVPTANLIHASDRALLAAHWQALACHWFWRAYPLSQVECWLLPEAPPATLRQRTGFNPKLYLSTRLKPEQIDLLYSEQMALDL